MSNKKQFGMPEAFHTQFGTFMNHNFGEFGGYLSKPDYSDDYCIRGNFIAMFDCGPYSYAISNLTHMGIGTFAIIQIDASLKATTIYQNWNTNNWGTPACPLEYLQHGPNPQGHAVRARNINTKEIVLFQIDNHGHYTIRTKPPGKR